MHGMNNRLSIIFKTKNTFIITDFYWGLVIFACNKTNIYLRIKKDKKIQFS